MTKLDTHLDVTAGGAETLHLRPRAAWLPARWETLLIAVVLAAAWQAASTVYPPFLFPPLEAVWASFWDLVSSPQGLSATATTYLRIAAWLIVTFVFATGVGVVAGLNSRVERFILPLIQLKQGIPGVCWIIFAVLWFRDMETRTAFVIITSCLPSLFFQARDGVHSIPKELWDMVRALRPGRLQMLWRLILPGIVPSLFTGFRINIGTATRVTVMAELIGGISGIGHQLALAVDLFRMDRAVAWTIILVAFVLVSNGFLSLAEKRLLRWRPAKEGGSD